jgi:Transposase DDE domain
MATSGRCSGMVAYHVQSAVDATNHLIVAHEVTNVGTDRSQLATMAQAARAALRSDNLDVVADRGYFKGEEILACEQARVAVTPPKPQTSGAKSAGRSGKPDFVHLAKDDVHRCPAGEKLEQATVIFSDGISIGSAETYPTIAEAMTAAAFKLLDMRERQDALDACRRQLCQKSWRALSFSAFVLFDYSAS